MHIIQDVQKSRGKLFLGSIQICQDLATNSLVGVVVVVVVVVGDVVVVVLVLVVLVVVVVVVVIVLVLLWSLFLSIKDRNLQRTIQHASRARTRSYSRIQEDCNFRARPYSEASKMFERYSKDKN